MGFELHPIPQAFAPCVHGRSVFYYTNFLSEPLKVAQRSYFPSD